MLAPVLALGLSLQAASAVPEDDRGARLYKQCRSTMRVQDGTADASDHGPSTFCVAYIDGFTDGVLMAGGRAICVNGANLATLARVYVAYMESHPKMMDAERAAGLVDALLDNYSCPIPKKK